MVGACPGSPSESPLTMFETRMQILRERLETQGMDAAVITNEDNVYYLTGYYDYLHMEFGRPTILVVPRQGESLLITPTIDLNTAIASARVDRISAWNDGMGDEWRAELPGALISVSNLGLEPDRMPPLVRSYMDHLMPRERQKTVTPILSDMRMIKSTEEQQLARHAGQVANAMMSAGSAAIADGVPEYEVRLSRHRPERVRRQSFWPRITTTQTCRPTRIFCRSWPRAKRSPKRIIARQHGSCARESQFSCVSAA